jgi:hypothetical protein
MDSVVMPFFHRQRRASSAPRVGLQPWQFHADTRDAQGGGAVVADQSAGEADQIGATVVSHGRYVTFQMAEVAVSRLMFRDILMLIARLRATPASG